MGKGQRTNRRPKAKPGETRRLFRVCRRCHRRMEIVVDDRGMIVDGYLARAFDGKFVCTNKASCHFAQGRPR